MRGAFAGFPCFEHHERLGPVQMSAGVNIWTRPRFWGGSKLVCHFWLSADTGADELIHSPPWDCKAWRDQGTDRFSKAIRQEAENLLATSPYNPTGAEPTMPLRVVQQLVPDERKRNHTLEHSRCSERERTSRTRAAVPDVSTWELVDNVKSNLNNNT